MPPKSSIIKLRMKISHIPWWKNKLRYKIWYKFDFQSNILWLLPRERGVYSSHRKVFVYWWQLSTILLHCVVLLSSINIQGFVRFESFWLSIAVLLITYLVIFFYSHHFMIINLSHSWMKKEMCKKNSVVVRNRSINTMIFVGTIVTSCQVLLSYFKAGWALPLQFNLLICEFKHDNVLYIPSVSKYFWTPGDQRRMSYI